MLIQSLGALGHAHRGSIPRFRALGLRRREPIREPPGGHLAELSAQRLFLRCGVIACVAERLCSHDCVVSIFYSSLRCELRRVATVVCARDSFGYWLAFSSACTRQTPPSGREPW